MGWHTRPDVDCAWGVSQDFVISEKGLFGIAAYAPSRSLKHLDRPDRMDTLTDPFNSCLAFESTVNNEGIQAWLLSLHTRRALAKQRGKSTESYERSLSRFEAALKLVCGQDVHFEVEIDPTFQLRLRVFGQTLNFSQLPDGIRNTVGWLADYMMRQDLMRWDPSLNGQRPGILLLDEVDAHLHPRWQRTLLPAMRKALPDVQIIVSSHSPFVISSCPGSRVHVLDLDSQGRAHARPPVDAPFGESVTATLKDIFGVSSRFDIRTAEDLAEWNDLKKKEVSGSLSHGDQRRLESLTKDLFDRSEELRSIVGSPPTLSDALVQALVRRKKATPVSRRSESKSSRKRQPLAG
jgi:predicted ATP-binding protein involved in virulence